MDTSAPKAAGFVSPAGAAVQYVATQYKISRFFGIAIKIFREEHPPPHFHAEYGEYEALIAIQSLTVIDGNLPSRPLGMVVEWASEHHKELADLWERAIHHQPMYKISPLK